MIHLWWLRELCKEMFLLTQSTRSATWKWITCFEEIRRVILALCIFPESEITGLQLFCP